MTNGLELEDAEYAQRSAAESGRRNSHGLVPVPLHLASIYPTVWWKRLSMQRKPCWYGIQKGIFADRNGGKKSTIHWVS